MTEKLLETLNQNREAYKNCKDILRYHDAKMKLGFCKNGTLVTFDAPEGIAPAVFDAVTKCMAKLDAEFKEL